jgi:hypothetical protein
LRGWPPPRPSGIPRRCGSSKPHRHGAGPVKLGAHVKRKKATPAEIIRQIGQLGRGQQREVLEAAIRNFNAKESKSSPVKKPRRHKKPKQLQGTELTVSQVAYTLHLSTGTVTRFVDAGHLTSNGGHGHQRRIHLASVLLLIVKETEKNILHSAALAADDGRYDERMRAFLEHVGNLKNDLLALLPSDEASGVTPRKQIQKSVSVDYVELEWLYPIKESPGKATQPQEPCTLSQVMKSIMGFHNEIRDGKHAYISTATSTLLDWLLVSCDVLVGISLAVLGYSKGGELAVKSAFCGSVEALFAYNEVVCCARGID